LGLAETLSREITKEARYQYLQPLTQSIKPENGDPEALVFPNREGNPINYNDFGGAWKTVTKLVNLEQENGMLPHYNCRATFITLQALQGNSSVQ